MKEVRDAALAAVMRQQQRLTERGAAGAAYYCSSSSGSSGSSGAVSSSGAVGNGLGLCVELSLGRTAGHNEGGEGGNEGDLLVHGIYWFW